MKKTDVINFFGSQAATARAVGIKRAAVSKWPEEIPLLRAYQIEAITNGKLKAGINEGVQPEVES